MLLHLASIVVSMRLYWFALILFVASACGPKQAGTSNGPVASAQTSAPIVIRYVGLATPSSPITSDTAPSVTIDSGRVFWLSNSTTNMVAVSVAAEIQRPSGWELVTNRNNPNGRSSLLIRTASSRRTFVLAPGQAAYGVPRGNDPWAFARGDVWRVKAFINEQVHGVDKAVAVAKNYPGLLRQQIKSGNTNMSANPNKIQWFGPATEITGPATVEP